jgi:hypothetical protein
MLSEADIRALFEQRLALRAQRRAELKQRRAELEAAGRPTGRSYKDQPAWKQANREKKETVQRLRDDLRARWPDVAFRVNDRLTYSPRSYGAPFHAWVDWTGGPSEAEVEQFAAQYVQDGAQRLYRIEYMFDRRDTPEEQAQRERWRVAGACWRCGSPDVETTQERVRRPVIFNGETRFEESVNTNRHCRGCGSDYA